MKTIREQYNYNNKNHFKLIQFHSDERQEKKTTKTWFYGAFLSIEVFLKYGIPSEYRKACCMLNAQCMGPINSSVTHKME